MSIINYANDLYRIKKNPLWLIFRCDSDAIILCQDTSNPCLVESLANYSSCKVCQPANSTGGGIDARGSHTTRLIFTSPCPRLAPFFSKSPSLSGIRLRANWDSSFSLKRIVEGPITHRSHYRKETRLHSRPETTIDDLDCAQQNRFLFASRTHTERHGQLSVI